VTLSVKISPFSAERVKTPTRKSNVPSVVRVLGSVGGKNVLESVRIKKVVSLFRFVRRTRADDPCTADILIDRWKITFGID